MQVTVNTVRAARDQIAARKQELEATRARLKQRTAELATARRKQHATLTQVRKQQDDLEGDLTEISQKIAEQLAAGHRRAPGRADQGRGPRIDLAGQRPGRLRLGPGHRAAGTIPRGDRHRGARPARRSAPPPRGPSSIAGSGGRLRELHLHRSWGRPLHLLRAPGAIPRLRQASRWRRRQIIGISGLHRPLPRPPRPLRGPGQRSGGRSPRLPVARTPRSPLMGKPHRAALEQTFTSLLGSL